MNINFPLLQKAFDTFKKNIPSTLHENVEAFCKENAWWLDDFALFVSLKEAHGGAVWTKWDPEIALRSPDAVSGWRKKLSHEIEARKFWQYLFFTQWRAVKEYCQERGIKIIGDIPIYVAHDSCDVWANPGMFYLDEKGDPTVVAGVPPDYFSETGQLWGNPIYRWDRFAKSGYQWWIDRFRQILTQVDIVRLDHFRGFEAYWEVPASESTAVNGQWVKGPGGALFDALENALGKLPVIAENLGVITPKVEALRERYNLPGMVILQFGFGADAECGDLPHNYTRDTAAYTGNS